MYFIKNHTIFAFILSCVSIFFVSDAAGDCDFMTKAEFERDYSGSNLLYVGDDPEKGAHDTSHCSHTQVKYHVGTYSDSAYITQQNPQGYVTKYFKVTSCDACDSGFRKTARSEYVGSGSSNGPCTFTYYDCLKECCCDQSNPDCTNPCTTSDYVPYNSDTCPTGGKASVWGGPNSNHIRTRFRGEKVDGCCKKTYEYTCDTGYYGQPTNASTGCELCPVKNIYTDSALTSKAKPTSISGLNPKEDYCYYSMGTYYTKSGTLKIEASNEGSSCEYNGYQYTVSPQMWRQSHDTITKNGINGGTVEFSWGKFEYRAYCLASDRPATMPTADTGDYCWCTIDFSDRSYALVTDNGYRGEGGCDTEWCTNLCYDKIRGNANFRIGLFQGVNVR